MPPKAPLPEEVNFICFSQVQEITGINNRTTLARYEEQGLFPRRIKLGNSKIAWVRQEVDQWVSDRISERKAQATTNTKRTDNKSD